MRFPLEVFDAVRAAFPADKPVGMRVSASDWLEGGWDLEQTIAFAQELKKRGLDWIDVLVRRRLAVAEDSARRRAISCRSARR